MISSWSQPGPRCVPERDLWARCNSRTTGRRAARAKETLFTSRGLRQDSKDGALG